MRTLRLQEGSPEAQGQLCIRLSVSETLTLTIVACCLLFPTAAPSHQDLGKPLGTSPSQPPAAPELLSLGADGPVGWGPHGAQGTPDLTSHIPSFPWPPHPPPPHPRPSSKRRAGVDNTVPWWRDELLVSGGLARLERAGEAPVVG